MTTPVSVDNVVPPEMTIPPNQSAAKAILNDRWLEIPPMSQESFQYGTNDTISFRFGSNLEFVNFPMSYISMDVELEVEGTPTLEDIQMDGGPCSLFRQERLVTVNGEVEFEDYRDSNRLHAIHNQLFQDKDMRQVMGHPMSSSYHALGDNIMIKPEDSTVYLGTLKSLDGTTGAFLRLEGYAESTYNNDGQLFNQRFIDTAYAPLPKIMPGAILQVNGVAQQADNERFKNQSNFVRVRAVNYNPEYPNPINAPDPDPEPQYIDLVLDCWPGMWGAGVPLASEFTVTVVVIANPTSSSRYGLYCRHDEQGLLTFKSTILYKPQLELWKTTFPLLFVQGGLRLELIMDNMRRSLWQVFTAQIYQSNPNNLTKLVINSPRLHLRYITPHPSIRNTIRQEFDSETGLEMAIMHKRMFSSTRQPSTTSDTIEYFTGLRSVRGVVLGFQDSELADSVSDVALFNRSLSHLLGTGITEIYMQIGSLNFPITPIDVDQDGMELLHHALLFCERMYPGMKVPALQEKEWNREIRYIVDTDLSSNQAFDVAFRPYCFDLSRAAAPFGFLTGVDTTSMPIIFHIKREGIWNSHLERGFRGQLRARLLVYYDRIITMSARSGISTSE